VKTKANLLRLATIAFLYVIPLRGHFQMIIPGEDIVEEQSKSTMTIDCRFCHPFEGEILNMAYPAEFGVIIRDGDKVDLRKTLSEYKIEGLSAWHANYKMNQPGDHVFYIVPEPYWEPAEEIFIIHYTKVIVSGYGLESGWDAEVGMKTEIIPMTRPYGLYAGNIFQGMVLVDGKPAPFTEVEVEYYNKDGKYIAPAAPFITQVVKADANGVFSYAMPAAGWWAFAALNEAEEKLTNPTDGESYPVEIGALIWVRTAEMK
jgi:cobalt/nickel transport protein